MSNTVSEIQLRKAVLSYFCSTVSAENLIVLKQALMNRDPSRSGLLPNAEFQAGLAEGGMPIPPREFEMLCQELDPQTVGSIQYKIFLNEVYVTKMYLKEMQLYNTLQEADTEGRGGVTIAEMKNILAEFQFPEDALGAAFQAMLKADINQIEPECIIDTEKFIASLHKEFSSFGQKQDEPLVEAGGSAAAQ